MNQSTDPTMVLRDVDFKDESPLKTVENIKRILHTYGIETEEKWGESCVPYCFSIRITVVGTTFGTNGKGMTKEFALASGYGELMERLQLGSICRGDLQKGGSFSAGDGRSEVVPAEELLCKNRTWYEAFSRKLNLYTGQTLTPEEILMQYADQDGNITCTPFYCINTRTKEFLPTTLRQIIYTTNGCAAGNTAEESIVQGMSEIMERYNQLRTISENITLPDIPEDVLKQYPAAYEIISFIRDSGFRVVIKDCSLGQKFPVVCACIIDTKTGKYHTHFGAYPIFEIALERSLTESFQGRSINNIAEFDGFCYKKDDVFALDNFLNELCRGSAEKMPGFFSGTPGYPYNENMGFTGTNNRALLQECIDFFTQQGCDILVRDCSCLGFPTHQVLIPGYSEVFCHRFSPKYNDLRYMACAKRALRDPSAAKFDDLLGTLMHLSQTSKIASNFSALHGFLGGTGLSANLSDTENTYLLTAALAHINYTLGRYADAVKHIGNMLRLVPSRNEEYLLCVKRYLSLLANRYEKAEIKATLEFFHRPETVEHLYSYLTENKNPLEDLIVHCNAACSQECLLYGSCNQKRVEELTHIIRTKSMELKFDTLANQLQAYQ